MRRCFLAALVLVGVLGLGPGPGIGLRGARAQAVDCSGYNATISASVVGNAVGITASTNAIPFANSLHLHVINVDSSTRASVVVPSRTLTSASASGGVTFSRTWQAGTAIGNASDASLTSALILLGITPSQRRTALSIEYQSSDGCIVTSATTPVFWWGVQPDYTGPFTTNITVESTTHPPPLLPMTFRDGDQAVVRVRTSLPPGPNQWVDLVPLDTSMCMLFLAMTPRYTITEGARHMDNLVPLSRAAYTCVCQGSRQNRMVCDERRGHILHMVVTSTRATSSTSSVFMETPLTAFPITFPVARRADTEVVSNGVIGMSPVCTMLSVASAYRRGDVLEALCEFPEKPVAVSVTPTIGSTEMLAALNDHIQDEPSTAASPSDGAYVVSGRLVYRQRLRWVVGSAMRPGTFSSLALLHQNSAFVTQSTGAVVVVAYNYRLGGDLTKVFFASTQVRPANTMVTASSPLGTPANLMILAASVPVSLACDVNVTSSTAANVAPRVGDMLSTRIACDTRIAEVVVRISTIRSGETQVVDCALAGSAAVLSAARPTYTIERGSFVWRWQYTHVIGNSTGVFGQPTCTAAVTGVLRTQASVAPLGGSGSESVVRDIVIAAGRARDALRLLAPPIPEGVHANPVVMNLTGTLSAAHSSITLRLVPHAAYSGAGLIPATDAIFEIPVAAAQPSEIDTFVRTFTSNFVTGLHPTLDPFSSRPYNVSVRSNDPLDGEPVFRALAAPFVFAPRAAAPLLTLLPTVPGARMVINDDVADTRYWVWIESPLRMDMYSNVLVPLAAHTEVRTATRLSYTFDMPLYHTPASLGEFVANQMARPPNLRDFPMTAQNLRFRLALEPKPRVRFVQAVLTSVDGATAKLLTTTSANHSDAHIFSAPTQEVAIASPSPSSAFVGTIPFVVAYRSPQVADASHFMYITDSAGVLVATLVCTQNVPSVSQVGALAFDLNGNNLTAGGLWRPLGDDGGVRLAPGAYNFAFSVPLPGGDASATVTATVTNVFVDSLTAVPLDANSSLISLSGELRDRASVVVAFTPAEAYAQVDVVFRRVSPADDVLRITLSPPSVGAPFAQGVRATRTLAITGAIARMLAPTDASTEIEFVLECRDAGGNPFVRHALSERYTARRGVVDFLSTIAMNPRNGGPRTASVVLEAHLILSVFRMDLIPVQPTVPAPAPGSTGGVLAHPTTRVFEIVPPSPDPATGLTRVAFDLNLEALQSSSLIFPRPAEIGVRDGLYTVRFTLGGEFLDTSVYELNQTTPLVVDTRTLLPVIGDCVVHSAGASGGGDGASAGAMARLLDDSVPVRAGDVVVCNSSVPESALNLTYALVVAGAGAGAGDATDLAGVVLERSAAFALRPFAWRVGVRFGNATRDDAPSDGFVSYPEAAPEYGFMDRRVSIRVSYRDTNGNGVAQATSVAFVLRAAEEDLALRLEGSRATSLVSPVLWFKTEPSSTTELRVHAAVGESMTGPVAGAPLFVFAYPELPASEGAFPLIGLPDGRYVLELRSRALRRTVASSAYVSGAHVDAAAVVVSDPAESHHVFVVDTVTDAPVLARSTTGVATIGSLHRLTCSASEPLLSRVLIWVDSLNNTRVTIPIPDGAPCAVEWVIGSPPLNAQSLPFANVTGVPIDVTGNVAETWVARLSASDVFGNPRAVSEPLVLEIDGLAPSAPPTLLQPQGGSVVGRSTRTVPLAYTLPVDPLPGSVFVYFTSQASEGGVVGPMYAIRMFNARSPPPLFALSLVRASQASDPTHVLTPITADVIRDGVYQVSLCYAMAAGAGAACARTTSPVVVDTTAFEPAVSFVTGPGVSLHAATGEPVYTAATGVRLRVESTDTTTPARFRLTLHHTPLAGHPATLGAGSAAAGSVSLPAGLSVFPTVGLEPGVFEVALPLAGGESAFTTAASSAIPDGNYTVRVVYTDAVGNVAPVAVVPGRMIVDSRTLPVRLISPVAGQSFGNGALVPIQIGFDANERYSSVRMSLVNSLGAEFVYDVRTTSRVAVACSWDTAESQPALFTPCFSSGGPLPNGVYDITVRAIDANSNPSASVQVLSVSIFTRVATGTNDTAPVPPPDTVTIPPQLFVAIDDRPLSTNSSAAPPRVAPGGTVNLRFVLGEVAAAGSMQLEVWMDGVRRVTVRPDAMQMTWVIGSLIPGTVLFQTDSVAPTGRMSGRVTFTFSYTDERRNPRAFATSLPVAFEAANVSVVAPLAAPVLASFVPSPDPWRYELRVLFPSVETTTATYALRSSAPYASSGTVPSTRVVSLVLRQNPASGTFVDPSSRIVFPGNGRHVLNVSYAIGSRTAQSSISLVVTGPPPLAPTDGGSSDGGGGGAPLDVIIGATVGVAVAFALGGILWKFRVGIRIALSTPVTAGADV